MTITIYTTPGCGACVAVKSAMRRASVEYTEVDLTTNRAALRFVKDRLRHKSAPVVVQTDPRTGAITDHWEGMRPDRIREAVSAERRTPPWPPRARRAHRTRRTTVAADAEDLTDPASARLVRHAVEPGPTGPGF